MVVLVALLASPLITVEAAGVNTAEPSIISKLEDSSPQIRTGGPPRTVAFAELVGKRVGEQVRKWVSYKDSSLIDIGSEMLPESALD